MHTEMEHLLLKTSALRSERDAIAAMINDHPERYPELLKCATHKEKAISVKACWILELLILSTPDYLDEQREMLHTVFREAKEGSAIRPLAKIIAFWSEQVITKHNEDIPSLSPEEIRQLTELAFTWLLGDYPVAVRVFSMEALFHLGKDVPWVHEELMAVIEKHYPTDKPAFRARARHLLPRLQKST